MGDLEPTETSPLLAKSTIVIPEPGHAPVGALPADNGASGNFAGRAKYTEDEEGQGEPDRNAQYEGMPEVRAKLKYIMPAIAVGVRSLLLREITIVQFQSDIPVRWRPDHYRVKLHKDRK